MVRLRFDGLQAHHMDLICVVRHPFRLDLSNCLE